ncbi:MAG: tetratricopeptide repeat protein [Thermoguttaceae bacterium]|nr:tetratricopeptide repeat protein [Thermoguttaceae bacterium]MDW8078936.1 tetratricopeptide repeat protein [Thermoguttaceae bacterium]
MSTGAKKHQAYPLLGRLLLVCALSLSTGGCQLPAGRLPAQSLSGIHRSLRPADTSTNLQEQIVYSEWQKAHAEVLGGDYPAAIARLKELARRDPTNLEVKLFLADTLLAAGSPAEALTILAQVELSAPQDARVHHLLGLAWDALGEPRRALYHHEKAILLDPANEVYLACYEQLAEALSPPSGHSPAPPAQP